MQKFPLRVALCLSVPLVLVAAPISARGQDVLDAKVGSVDAAHLTGTYKPRGTTIDNAALLMAGDLHEHLGQLIAYARMNGVKPPWTK